MSETNTLKIGDKLKYHGRPCEVTSTYYRKGSQLVTIKFEDGTELPQIRADYLLDERNKHEERK